MKFSHLLALVLYSAMAFAMPLDAAQAATNCIIFLTDDQRPDAVGALGNEAIRTPHMDRLVHEGFAFRQAYCMGSHVGAVCLPSRTQLLTGMSMFRARDAASGNDPAHFTFPRTMNEAGFATLRTGKRGNHPGKVCAEFDRYIQIERHTTCCTEHADNAMAFIREHAGERPFFICISFGTPHDPQPAPAEYYDEYQADDMPLSPNFMAVHPFDNGEMLVRDEMTLPFPRTPTEVREKLADYYASITYTDAQMGRVLQLLDELNQRDNTLIVFASDNGLSLGDHGLLGKQNVYEFGGMHVPLVFAGPGVPVGESDALVYLHDVYPTVCALTGINVPMGLDGRNLAPIIQGRSSSVRDYVLTAYRDVQRAVRNDRWKLIRYPKINRSQLFDLQNDPFEQHDLADDPNMAEKLAEMTALMKRAQAEYDDPAPLTVENPASGEIDVATLQRRAREK